MNTARADRTHHPRPARERAAERWTGPPPAPAYPRRAAPRRSDVAPKPRPVWEIGRCARLGCRTPMHILRWTAHARRGPWADAPPEGTQVSRYHPGCDPNLPPLTRDPTAAQLDALEAVRALTGGRKAPEDST